MSNDYINIADPTHPAAITRYTGSSTYNSAGDNVPFSSLEDRGTWFSNLHQKLGIVYIGKVRSLTSSNTPELPNYTLVLMDNTGILTEATTLAAPYSVPTFDVGTGLSTTVGIVYPVDGATSVAYSEIDGLYTNVYYYVIVSSDFMSLPIGTSAVTSIFGPSTWQLPAPGNRVYNTISVGDYIYFNDDPTSQKFVAYPKNTDITSVGTPLGDDYNKLLCSADTTTNKLKLGYVVAKTNTDYVIYWTGGTSSYGTQVTDITSHTGLYDTSNQLANNPDPNPVSGTPWGLNTISPSAEPHPEYVKRTIAVPTGMLLTSPNLPVLGDVMEILGASYANAGKYQVSQNSNDAVLAGIYIGVTQDGNYHYILARED